jgi:hypothetical protein
MVLPILSYRRSAEGERLQLAGRLGVVFCVLTQLAALGMILVMSGAIYKKIVVWQTGFGAKSRWGGTTT